MDGMREEGSRQPRIRVGRDSVAFSTNVCVSTATCARVTYVPLDLLSSYHYLRYNSREVADPQWAGKRTLAKNPKS